MDWVVGVGGNWKVLLVSWFDGLARILSCVEDFGSLARGVA